MGVVKGNEVLKAHDLEAEIPRLKNRAKKLFSGRGAVRARKRWILDEANRLVAEKNNQPTPESCFPATAFKAPPDAEEVAAIEAKSHDDDMTIEK
jgi:hypothetical protein